MTTIVTHTQFSSTSPTGNEVVAEHLEGESCAICTNNIAAVALDLMKPWQGEWHPQAPAAKRIAAIQAEEAARQEAIRANPNAEAVLDMDGLWHLRDDEGAYVPDRDAFAWFLCGTKDDNDPIHHIDNRQAQKWLNITGQGDGVTACPDCWPGADAEFQAATRKAMSPRSQGGAGARSLAEARFVVGLGARLAAQA